MVILMLIRTTSIRIIKLLFSILTSLRITLETKKKIEKLFVVSKGICMVLHIVFRLDSVKDPGFRF